MFRAKSMAIAKIALRVWYPRTATAAQIDKVALAVEQIYAIQGAGKTVDTAELDLPKSLQIPEFPKLVSELDKSTFSF